MKIFLTSMYSLVLALWVGGMSIYSFLVTPIIFKSYSRAMAGEIVGHLFAWYFKYNLTLISLALVLFFFVRPSIRWVFYASATVLVTAFVLSIMTVTIIHPKAKKIKEEVHSLDSETESKEARRAFAKVHGISMLINIIIICAGVAMVVLTTFGLVKGQAPLSGG